MSELIVLPEAARSGVLKYVKPEVMVIRSVYRPLVPLSSPKTDIVPILPAGNELGKFSHAHPYCCFFRILAYPEQHG